jgi:predicted nucleotidyltransferase
MNQQDALSVLRKHSDELRARGVEHAALFGSTARGVAGADSDLDILIEISPVAELDVYAYASLKRYIAGLFTGPVDVVNREALKPGLRHPATADAIYAF